MNVPFLDLSRYDGGAYDRGASRLKEGCWLLIWSLLTAPPWLSAYRLKAAVLRWFGAKVGMGVVIKPGAKISMPWRLRMGDHVWIGEQAWLQSLAEIEIGSHVCISQGAWLFTGGHDWTDPAFGLMTRPVRVEDGVWIGARAWVGPGVTIGHNAVIGAGSVVVHDVPPDRVCAGNPCAPIKTRKARVPPS